MLDNYPPSIASLQEDETGSTPKTDRTRSLRAAIDRNCKDCIYDRAAKGTWRQQVTMCSLSKCSLWPVRPVSRYPIPERLLHPYQPDSDSVGAPNHELDRLEGPSPPDDGSSDSGGEVLS